jgi:hypothetical protein
VKNRYMSSSFKKILISACISMSSVVLLFLFWTVPSGNLWKGYRIMYVSSSCDNLYAESVIAKAGCTGVIDFASQNIPLVFPAGSPEVSLAASDADESGYLFRRSAYFFDKGGNYRLYYIPDEHEKNAEAAVSSLLQAGISCGIDIQTEYPWIIPVICFCFAVFLCILSPHRFVFSLSSVIPVFFAFCMPFYPGASAVCLLLYALFLMQQVWGRKNAFHFLTTNIPVIFFTAASVVIAVMTSFRCGLLFIAAAAGSLSVVYLLWEVEHRRTIKYSFVPVPIRPAESVPFITGKTVRGMAVCASFIMLLIAVSLVSSDFSQRSSKQLQLPSAGKGGISDSLPSLDDYVVWCWNAESAPYRSVNASDYETEKRKPKDGDTVRFPLYEDSSGRINENAMVLKYDADFRKKAVAQIDGLTFPAVEKLMKKQGKKFHAGYAFSTPGGSGFAYLVLMIVSMCIPIFFFVYTYSQICRRSKNK